MDIEEFISTTLVSIYNGVNKANEEIIKNKTEKPRYFWIHSYNDKDADKSAIVFDIAVTTAKENTKTGGWGIKVKVVEAGGKINSKNTQENVSRIKFVIHPRTSIS